MFNPDYRASLSNSPSIALNKNQLTFAPDFVATRSGTYTSQDPRLVDSIRGIRMELDAPVFDGTLLARDRYNDTNVGTQTYSSYQDITGGQVSYSLDTYMTQPFSSPNFQLRSKVNPSIFRDPMGALKPMYTRVPIVSTPGYVSGYRHDQDELSHREDMMALQLQKRHQSDWQLYQNSHFVDFPLEACVNNKC